MRTRIAGVFAAACLAVPATAAAQHPGSLDPAFGTGGRAGTPIANGGYSGSVARTPDGHYFAGGAVKDQEWRYAFGIARFDANGAPDQAFGDHGTVLLQLGESSFTRSDAVSVIAQPDGGVIAVGSATRLRDGAPESAVAAVRLDRTGRTLWQAFHQVARPKANGAFATGAAAQPDGKIVVVLQASVETLNYNVGLLRINPEDGSLDRAFGGTGYVHEQRDHTDGRDAEVGDMVLTRSGTIVVAGAVGRPCGHNRCYEPLLQAWTPDGRQVPGFGAGDVGLDLIDEVAEAPDGSIYAYGATPQGRGNPYGTRVGIVRYTPGGQLDAAFGLKVFAPPPGFEDSGVGGLTFQPDGRLLVGLLGIRGRLVRLLPDGTRDESFGYGGVGSAGVRLLGDADPLLQDDGRIVTVGTPEQDPPPCTPDGCGYLDPINEFALGRVLGGTALGQLSLEGSAPVRRRVARLRLTCTARGASDCAGELKLQARRRRSGHRATFGHAGFRIPAGESAKVRVSLDRGALRRLRRASRRRMVVRVRILDAAGAARVDRLQLIARGSLR
ncbi:MAG TPA: hypothetical protein VF533_05240 [Solirubrobacteraceae bacterium]|jgi:uncharacterized delta-60 repeat protein